MISQIGRIEMKSFVFFLGFLMVTVQGTGGVLETFVDERNTEYCRVHGKGLYCDFNFSQMDVYINATTANNFHTVFVRAVTRLLLQDGLCTSLSLYHISSIIYVERDRNGYEEAKPCAFNTLSLYNVTINHIPQGINVLNMEESILSGEFLAQPTLQRAKVTSSSIHKLNLNRSTAFPESELRFHGTKINSLVKIEMSNASGVFVTDSSVSNIEDGAVILRNNSTAEFRRIKVQQGAKITVIIYDDARIDVTDVTGSIDFSHRGKKTQRNIEPELPDQQTFPSLIITLLVILSVSFILNICAFGCLIKIMCFGNSCERKKTTQNEEGDVVRETKYVLVSG